MAISEGTIKITRKEGKITSISVVMPIWHKESEHGHLNIQIPLLRIETIAKDEEDSEDAIKEAIESFCIIADKFGEGLDSELRSLGWLGVDSETGEELLGFSVNDPDSLLERIMQTGDSYVNPKLDIGEPELSHA